MPEEAEPEDAGDDNDSWPPAELIEIYEFGTEVTSTIPEDQS